MSRFFVQASSQYLNVARTPLTAAPLTMACWFNSNDAATAQVLMGIGDTGGDNNFFRIAAQGNVAGDPVRVLARNGGTTGTADTSTGYSANTWHQACGVFASATDRTAYIDGGSAGNNTTSVTPAGVDSIFVGASPEATVAAFMNGFIAEAAIWNVALTAVEVLQLSKSISPLLVRPENLVAYWPLIGSFSPEIDIAGGFDLTVTGAVKADHYPGIRYPNPKIIMPF